MPKRDPIQRVADGTRDLYDVATWEPRSRLDAAAVRLHGGIRAVGKLLVVLLALAIVVSQVVLVVAATLEEPVLGAYILLSAVPALALAVYVWRADVTMREPVWLLTATFLLGIIFSGFALVFNTLLQGLFAPFGFLGLVLFFFLVVGPVEETVKWLAVRLYPFRKRRFDAVIDGAVYGAVAGLGFATIENSIYIVRQYSEALQMAEGANVLLITGGTAFVRSFAGPGHVIYSAFAGYYLGLAKFNPENRGPIVVKGLLIAALIHATYNSLSGVVATLAEGVPALSSLPPILVTLGFVLVYDTIFAYVLYRKLRRYRRTFRDVGADALYRDEEPVRDVEREEFEWDRTDELEGE